MEASHPIVEMLSSTDAQPSVKILKSEKSVATLYVVHLVKMKQRHHKRINLV